MANVRSYVFLLVLLVNYRLALSEPTFGSAIFCSLFCDDSDESSDDDSDDYDYDIFGICSMCGSKETSSKTTTTAKPEMSQPVKIMIPPANGLNLTLFSSIGGVLMDLVPWMATASTSATTAAPTTAAPATTAGNGSETTTAAATTKK